MEDEEEVVREGAGKAGKMVCGGGGAAKFGKGGNGILVRSNEGNEGGGEVDIACEDVEEEDAAEEEVEA